MEVFYEDGRFYFHMNSEEIERIFYYQLESDLKEKRTNKDLETKVTLEVAGTHCGTQVGFRPSQNGYRKLEDIRRIFFRMCNCDYDMLRSELQLGAKVFENDDLKPIGPEETKGMIPIREMFIYNEDASS